MITDFCTNVDVDTDDSVLRAHLRDVPDAVIFAAYDADDDLTSAYAIVRRDHFDDDVVVEPFDDHDDLVVYYADAACSAFFAITDMPVPADVLTAARRLLV